MKALRARGGFTAPARGVVERSRGVTLGICKALERAAIAAIRSGRERIELSSFVDPEVWRGVAVAASRQRAPGRGRAAA